MILKKRVSFSVNVVYFLFLRNVAPDLYQVKLRKVLSMFLLRSTTKKSSARVQLTRVVRRKSRVPPLSRSQKGQYAEGEKIMSSLLCKKFEYNCKLNAMNRWTSFTKFVKQKFNEGKVSCSSYSQVSQRGRKIRKRVLCEPSWILHQTTVGTFVRK